MKGTTSALVCAAVVAVLLAASAVAAADWPQWRGPAGTGVSTTATPPVSWSEGENVAWKVAIEGLGSSSPIIWGERVILTSARDTGVAGPRSAASDSAGRRGGPAPSTLFDFIVLCHERSTGRLLWRTVVTTAQTHEGTHPDGTYASPSPVTDGERIYAFFGSYGVHALTLDGAVLWSVDLGDMRTRLGFGEGSSPALAGEALIVNWDEEGQSFIVALDRRSGKELWRQQRDEATSWATPLVVAGPGGPQVIVNATNQVRSYAPADGKLLWEQPGMTVNVIPSPVARDGVVYVTSGFRGSALLALALDPRLSPAERVLWSYSRDTPYVPSPLLHDGLLYFLKVNSGILTVLDAESGAVVLGPMRVDPLDNVYASPVAAAGRIYLVGREGDAVVLAAGRGGEVLARNSLADRFDASPAMSGGDLVLRGRSHLYLLREQKKR